MKTKWTVILTVVVVLVLGLSMVAWAQTPTPTPNPQGGYGPGMGGAMQREQGTMPGMGFMHRLMDQDGDGVCDNFVDENKDGVCDNAGSGMMGGRMMQGMRHGRGIAQGMMQERGMGFVDADQDGVCDHMQAAQPSAEPSEE